MRYCQFTKAKNETFWRYVGITARKEIALADDLISYLRGREYIYMVEEREDGDIGAEGNPTTVWTFK